MAFGFETGLRRGELAGLKWSDIDLERRTATIRGAIRQTPGKTWYKSTKTDSVAAVALSDFALEAIRAQRVQQAKDKLAAGAMYDDQGFVFATDLGGLPSPGAISHAVRRIARRAGLSVRGVHAMRHSTGSWLIRSGVDVRTVAAILRHSAPSTTLNVYAHEMGGAQAAAVRNLLGANGNRGGFEQRKAPLIWAFFRGESGLRRPVSANPATSEKPLFYAGLRRAPFLLVRAHSGLIRPRSRTVHAHGLRTTRDRSSASCSRRLRSSKYSSASLLPPVAL